MAFSSLSFEITSLRSSAGFTVVLHVTHHLAVKSTSTGRPCVRAAATASVLHGAQVYPFGACARAPFAEESSTGIRQANFPSNAQKYPTAKSKIAMAPPNQRR